ncbi:hypothetical protein [Streptomyces sp. WMMB 322]|uniref:hypothetical protein n=1 Tax=Streptomyces sp. WMMB 322 TaxID=1286821 RepID=UPI0006E43B16|nr:hypothetical protein [Streptomyces sp. WMMB 322]SCK38860.1 hypothetical protein H180DRAFT_03304 [Streptomyces sp. WMMB 322]
MKLVLRSGAVTAAVGVGLSVAVLPAVPANATGGTHVRCNDITALKKAINFANTHPNTGPITLASNCTYNLTSPDNADDGLPEITGSDVTISGRNTTIRRAPTATQDFRILHVLNGGRLTLNSLTIRDGSLSSGGSGGGIANQQGGTLKLNRSVVRSNEAGFGGGLANLGGRLDLSRSTVERNTASTWGGGITNDSSGTMTMKGGSLRENRSGSIGGGLENINGTASMEDVSVRDNVSTTGGGIRNVNGSTVRLKSSTVRENIAVSGAGISNFGSGSTVTLVRSTVTRNTAINTGGGILNEAGGQVTLTASRVVRNSPDNCAPEGSVPGCSNPTGTVAPPSSAKLPPAADIKAGK